MEEYWHRVIKTKNNGLMALAVQHIDVHWSWVIYKIVEELEEKAIVVRVSENNYYAESDDAIAIETELKLISKGYARGSFDMVKKLESDVMSAVLGKEK